MKKAFTPVFIALISLLIVTCSPIDSKNSTELNSTFKELNDGISDDLEKFEISIRYFSNNNFIGRPIPGYYANKAFLTREAADALLLAQRDFIKQGYRLKIYDAYRPQTAVDYFSAWAADLEDSQNKSQYYPNISKSQLFADGYIAAKSGHSRGSAVDLTLLEIESGNELDMGSPWDFFDPISWVENNQITDQQRANRKLLASVMMIHGFKPLKEEWWHFSFTEEPFPETYFDFPID